MPLNSTGFERPRLAELKSDYDANFTEALGPVNTNADAVIGQFAQVGIAHDGREQLVGRVDPQSQFVLLITPEHGQFVFTGAVWIYVAQVLNDF